MRARERFLEGVTSLKVVERVEFEVANGPKYFPKNGIICGHLSKYGHRINYLNFESRKPPQLRRRFYCYELGSKISEAGGSCATLSPNRLLAARDYDEMADRAEKASTQRVRRAKSQDPLGWSPSARTAWQVMNYAERRSLPEQALCKNQEYR